MRAKQRGFALVELMIVTAVLAPIFFAILSTTGTVSNTVSATRAKSDSDESLRTSTDRILRVLRPASVQSLQVPDTGAWKTPDDGVDYPSLRFRIVDRFPSSNKQNLGEPRVLTFVLDDDEKANGRDDDGDGLIDEGRVCLGGTEGGRACLVGGVEVFALQKTGRQITLTLQTARRDKSGRVMRARAEEFIYLRNN